MEKIQKNKANLASLPRKQQESFVCLNIAVNHKM